METHQNTPAFRAWKRGVFHQVIRTVMSPIEQVMRTGVIMSCADGAQRLCFPVLCQYIGDMEEQWTLTCLIRPTCPKCHRRGTDEDGDELEIIWRDSEEDSSGTVAAHRTDVDAFNCRKQYSEDATFPLKRFGYHLDKPFSRNYPHGGILEAVCCTKSPNASKIMQLTHGFGP